MTIEAATATAIAPELPVPGEGTAVAPGEALGSLDLQARSLLVLALTVCAGWWVGFAFAIRWWLG